MPTRSAGVATRIADSWAQYIAQFMALYTEPPAEGYRLPTVKEAEEADR